MSCLTKFNIDDFPGEYAMHCLTEEQAVIFVEYLASSGRHWSSGEEYSPANPHYVYGERTHYYFNRGQFGTESFALSNDYTILEFEDFLWGKDSFNPKHYKGEEVVLSISSEEEACIVASVLNNYGLKWIDDSSYTGEEIWERASRTHSNSVCLNFNTGTWDCESYYRSKNYRILYFSDFVWNESVAPWWEEIENPEMSDFFKNIKR